ncbi:MAG: hypothetical protein AB1749_11520 [Pseudomonadota bacterium]
MTPEQHPAASHQLPFFIPSADGSDPLLAIMAVVLVGSLLAFGVFFFWLHSLPERMVHNKVQFDIVAVLALLSLFTHIHAFWVAALLIALINFPDFALPDFSSSLRRIAGSLETLTERASGATGGSAPPKSPDPAAEKKV